MDPSLFPWPVAPEDEKLKEPTSLDAKRADDAFKTQAPAANMQVGKPEVLKYGATEAPTLDLQNRPYVHNPDGSVSTVYSMGVDLDGKKTLIPKVSKDGRMMGDDEAVDEFRNTGEHMGVYPTDEASEIAGEKIHLDQMKNPPRATTTTIQMPENKIRGRVLEMLKKHPTKK